MSNSRSIISGTDLRISVPMTFMRSPGLRQFFYRKKKLIFFGHFFKFAVHYLSNGPEDFGSDDIYEVPGLRQFFYRKKKIIFLDHFFSNSRSIISGTDLRISVPMTFMRSPGRRPFLYIYINKYFWDHFFQIRHNGHDQSTSK